MSSEGGRIHQIHLHIDDDLLSETIEKAIQVIEEAKALCASEKLRLHKFISNSIEVEQVPSPEQAWNIQDLDLSFNNLPMERALRIQSSVLSNTLHFTHLPTERHHLDAAFRLL